MHQILISIPFFQTNKDFTFPFLWNFRVRFVPTSESLLLSKVDDYSDIYRWSLLEC